MVDGCVEEDKRGEIPEPLRGQEAVLIPMPMEKSVRITTPKQYIQLSSIR